MIITSKDGLVVPVGIPPASKSKVPKVYPDPCDDTVTVSIFESPSIVTVHSAPLPSPLIGTLV